MESYRHIDPKDMVWINLAAKKTNISANSEDPLGIYNDTIRIYQNFYAGAHRYNVGKVIGVVSSCCYPFNLDILSEDKIDSGPTHISVEPHGAAKRECWRLSKFYRQQYGLNSSIICWNNLYGGWDEKSEKYLKVADSLIKRIVEAKMNNVPVVDVWGDGSPRREFLHHIDAAKSIIRFLEVDSNTELINIGSGGDISIYDLSYLIKHLAGYQGSIEFLSEMPNGQMKKLLDVSLMKKLLNWEPGISLEDGLKRTINWYKERLI